MLTQEQATQLRSFMRESRDEAERNLRKFDADETLEFEVLDLFNSYVNSITQ